VNGNEDDSRGSSRPALSRAALPRAAAAAALSGGRDAERHLVVYAAREEEVELPVRPRRGEDAQQRLPVAHAHADRHATVARIVAVAVIIVIFRR
jgi:hypothetical protein